MNNRFLKENYYNFKQAFGNLFGFGNVSKILEEESMHDSKEMQDSMKNAIGRACVKK